jgi:tetratricopeptide (TPR) repeat protein
MPTIDELMDDGNTALAIGELEDAAKFFRQAVEQDANYQDGWEALGMALYKLERYPEAIEAGKIAAKLNPNSQFVWSKPRPRARRHALFPGVEKSIRSHWISRIE